MIVGLISLAAFLIGFVALYTLLPLVVAPIIGLITGNASSSYLFFGSFLQYMNLFAPVDTIFNLMLFAFGIFTLRLFAKLVFYAIALLRGNSPPNSGV